MEGHFQVAYKAIQAYLLQDAEDNLAVDPQRKRYLLSLMDVNCIGGKYNRGHTVIHTVETLLSSKTLTKEEKDKYMFEASICGWMIEMLQAHFLIEDDIMDSSITRRGRPCWYRFPGVSTQSAINDGLIVLAWCTELAFHYFEDRPTLVISLLKKFHRVDYKTTMGQFYDVTSMRKVENIDPNQPMEITTDYKEFTVANFKRIVKFKTIYYSFYLPLVMGLTLTQCNDVPDANVEDVASLMGEYFQAMDDYMDCFADPAVIGKQGTDIQDMKCSWLAVNFLLAANDEQLTEFKANYGKDDEVSVAKIKTIYNEANMPAKFDEYEKGVAAEMEKQITSLNSLNEPFAAAVTNLWHKTYKRSK